MNCTHADILEAIFSQLTGNQLRAEQKATCRIQREMLHCPETGPDNPPIIYLHGNMGMLTG